VIWELGKSRGRNLNCSSSSSRWLHGLSPGPGSCNLDQFLMSREGRLQTKETVRGDDGVRSPKYWGFLLFET